MMNTKSAFVYLSFTIYHSSFVIALKRRFSSSRHFLAEEPGFEPGRRFARPNGLANHPLRPLEYSSKPWSGRRESARCLAALLSAPARAADLTTKIHRTFVPSRVRFPQFAAFIRTDTIHPARFCISGAEEGNRTLVVCLEGRCTTIVLLPRFNIYKPLLRACRGLPQWLL